MQDLKKPLLRYHQREQIKTDIQQSEEMLAQAKPQDKAIILSSIKKSKHQLDSQSPMPLTPKEKDTLNALEKKLRAKITQNMPTEEVMRKNPAGAVDQHMKWERLNKPLVRMWKNAMIQLNPDSQDQDLANIERFRPSGQMDRLRTDAQIPGVMSYGNVPEENWPFDAPENTALAQAKRNYTEDVAVEEVDAVIDSVDQESEEDEKEECSIEKKAILTERLINAREVLRQKREAEKQLNETLEATPVQ